MGDAAKGAHAVIGWQVHHLDTVLIVVAVLRRIRQWYPVVSSTGCLAMLGSVCPGERSWISFLTAFRLMKGSIDRRQQAAAAIPRGAGYRWSAGG